jgi:hypothetical protein
VEHVGDAERRLAVLYTLERWEGDRQPDSVQVVMGGGSRAASAAGSESPSTPIREASTVQGEELA